jgi:hypothetical protein
MARCSALRHQYSNRLSKIGIGTNPEMPQLYRTTKRGISAAGIVGYRLLSVDYQKGSGVNRYEYDVLQHGPLLGLSVGF